MYEDILSPSQLETNTNRSEDLDKQSLAYAAVFGLVTDFDLHGTQYSWLGSIFFIGQLVSEFPFMYLMSKLPLARFVGFTV